MDLTTLARIKAQIPLTESDDDALIATIIAAWSKRVETRLDRHVQDLGSDRTEVFQMDRHERVLLLPGYPLVAAPTSVKVTTDKDFTAATALTENTAYFVDQEIGLIEFADTHRNKHNFVEVQSQGGMGTDTADFIVNFPDIVEALDMQIVARRRRRASPDGDISFSAGGIRFTKSTGELNDLGDVIDLHKRRGAFL